MKDLNNKRIKYNSNNEHKKIKIKRDSSNNKILSIEDIFYNRNIKTILPNHYSKSDVTLAKRLYKCATSRIYNNVLTPINTKEKVLNQFNWSNFKEAILNTVEAVRSYHIDKKIVCADITRIPFDNLFYNLSIKTHDSNNNEVIKTLKSIPTFSTGKLKMGYQEGKRDEYGNTVLNIFEPSSAEADKCYFSLNFIGDKFTETNKGKETIAIYYYLGNNFLN
jgi:hypothetical protein